MNNNNSKQKPIELKDVYEILSDIHNSIKESSKWAKFTGMKEVKSILEIQLQDETEKLVYYLSDGAKGTQEVAKIVGTVNYSAVFKYWKIWGEMGLGESIAVAGGSRFKHSFDLADFGIKIPEFSKQGNKQLVSEPTQTGKQPSTEVESNAN